MHSWGLEAAADYSDEDWERFRGWVASEAPPTVRHALYLALWRLLQLLSEPERQIALSTLRSWAGRSQHVRASHRQLSAGELVSLQERDLIEIGAHTVTHPLLDHLSPDDQREELLASRRALEEILGVPVRSFAYPYGTHSIALVPLVRDAGYTCACTTEPRAVPRGVDPFRLPRLQVENWDGEEFGRRLSGWIETF